MTLRPLLLWIPKNFQKLLAGGLLAGFALPTLLAPIAQFSDFMVAAIIFTSFLTRAPRSTDNSGTSFRPALIADLKLTAGNIVLMKVLFPVLVFFATKSFEPALAISLVLLASLPAAGVSPSLIRLLGGQSELGLRILFSESLASCITVPLLFSMLFSSQETVSPLALARYFSLVLLIPLGLATLARRWIDEKNIPAFMPNIMAWGSVASVLLIVTLVASIAGKIGPSLLLNPGHSGLLILIACLAVPVFAWVSVVANRSKSKEVAITFGIKNMYINIGLGLGVATSYFSNEVALVLLAYVIPANLMPRFIAKTAGRLVFPGS